MKRNGLQFGIGILLSGISLLFQFQALAITVTNLHDNGPGSLRQAIADAPAGGTIDFSVTGTIVLTSCQLVITNDLTVNGPGATTLTLSQNAASRILVVSNGNVTLSGLTVANGNWHGPYGYDGGGGINNLATLTMRNCIVASNYPKWDGGGISNEATLILSESLITSNYAFSSGGGLLNGGSATIIGSAICRNRLEYDIDGGWRAGGGILTWGSLVVSNSTISLNQNYGILHFWGTTLISSSTVVSNQTGDVGRDTSDPSPTIIRNSIFNLVAGWPITSEDYNFIGSTYEATWLVGPTEHNSYGQDPKLGPLADNGGPTPTHASRFDSPAIDAGHSGGAMTDQRGLPRPIEDPNTPNAASGDGSDIGACESDPMLKLTGLGATGTGVRVGLNRLLGRTYSVESETNLDNSCMVLSNDVAGTGGAVQNVNVGPSNLPRPFYRVRLLP